MLSFKDWVRDNPSIPFSLRKSTYDQYVKSFNIVETQSSIENDEIKRSYISYLKKLTTFYEDDPEVKKLEKLDYNDPIQLAGAIPIFTKKLKDLAQFSKNKREKLKDKKEEYSSKGSEVGLKNTLRDFILENYTIENVDDLDISIIEKYNV